MSKPLQVSPLDYHSKLKLDRSNVLSPDSWLSKSALWELKNGSLFKWRYHPKEFSPTPSMQWGSLVDCLVLTPELRDEMIAVSPYDSYRTKESREWRDEALSAGLVVISQDQLDEAEEAASMLCEMHLVSSSILGESQSQVVIGGRIDGLNVKGLVDIAPRDADYLADLKTTGDFSESGFARTIAKFGYHVQAALYLQLWNLTFPNNKRDRFLFVWQESSSPYEVAVTELSQDDIDRGWGIAVSLLKRIKNAAEHDSWPMAYESIIDIDVPTWAAIGEEIELGKNQE